MNRSVEKHLASNDRVEADWVKEEKRVECHNINQFTIEQNVQHAEP